MEKLIKRIQALEQNSAYDAEMIKAYQSGIITPDEWHYYQKHKEETAGIPKIIWQDSPISHEQRKLSHILSKSGSIIIWNESFTLE
jgi:hypothetical protein